jgi:hypothetical protein
MAVFYLQNISNCSLTMTLDQDGQMQMHGIADRFLVAECGCDRLFGEEYHSCSFSDP